MTDPREIAENILSRGEAYDNEAVLLARAFLALEDKLNEDSQNFEILALRERVRLADARLAAQQPVIDAAEKARAALPDGALVMRCAAGVASAQEGNALIASFVAIREYLALAAAPPEATDE